MRRRRRSWRKRWSPTLGCYQAYTAPCPPAVGGKQQRGDESKIKLHKSFSETFRIQDSPPRSSSQPKNGPIFSFAPIEFRVFTLFWFVLIKCNHSQASQIQVILTSYQILFTAMDVFEAISVEHSVSAVLGSAGILQASGSKFRFQILRFKILRLSGFELIHTYFWAVK